MSGMKKITGTIALAMSVSLPTLAWAGPWQGTWDTDFGQLRLIENGKSVYGDYGNKGTIEGVADARNNYLRAIYRRDDGGYGYVEFRQSSDTGGVIQGRYIRHQDAKIAADMPNSSQFEVKGVKWNGRQTDHQAPPLIKYNVNRKPKALSSSSVPAAPNNAVLQGIAKSMPPSPASIRNRGTTLFATWSSYGDLIARAARSDARSEAVRVEKRDDARQVVAKKQRLDAIAEKRKQEEILSGGNAQFPGDNFFPGDDLSPEKETRQQTLEKDAGEATIKKTSNALHARIPILKSYPDGFEPKWIDVTLHRLATYTPDNPTHARDKIYGRIGIYAACVTQSSTKNIKPFGGISNRVWDVTRRNAVHEKTIRHQGHFVIFQENVRRFPIDLNCLKDPNARLSVKFATNLVEKDNVEALDDKFGHRGKAVFLDELGLQNRSNTESFNSSHWQLIGSMEENSLGRKGKSNFKLQYKMRFVE